jgi:hypothetical protein
MQPEYSFSYHEVCFSIYLPTNLNHLYLTKKVDVFNENHKGAREKVRKSFRKHNRPYHIPTRNDIMAHIYVRPLDDINDTPIDWWNVPLIDEIDDNGDNGKLDLDSEGKLIIDI